MSKKILVCTIGETAQIVTETLWALRGAPYNWSPNEIHIVTTTFSFDVIRRELQLADGRLSRMYKGTPPPVYMHLPCESGDPATFGPADSGQPPANALRDVTTKEEAAAMGDAILRLLADIATDDETEIHLSLAGGRKTMSAHALLALSLVGRRVDRASHVLVAPMDFEGNRNFWHPDQEELVEMRPGSSIPTRPASEACVTLVETPLTFMRYQVKSAGNLAKLSLKQIVDEVNLARDLDSNPSIKLDTRANTITACGVARKLNPQVFSLMRLLYVAKRENWSGATAGRLGLRQAGRISVKEIAFCSTPEGQSISALVLQFLREAFLVESRGHDPERTLGAWQTANATLVPAGEALEALDGRKPLETSAAGGKLHDIELLVASFTRIGEAIRDQFGPMAGALIAPASDGVRGGEGPRFSVQVSGNSIEIV